MSTQVTNPLWPQTYKALCPKCGKEFDAPIAEARRVEELHICDTNTAPTGEKEGGG